jgi:general stress protein YciG
MSGTREGAVRARTAMLARFGGDEEAYKEHFRSIGRKGGRNSTNGGFASDKRGKDGLTGRQRAMAAGQKGGRVSRRAKSTYQPKTETYAEPKAYQEVQ